MATDLASGRRHVVALMPHTGECFSCGGAIAKHTAHGDRATLVSVCSGEKHLGDAWLRHVASCRRAAAVLGAEFEAMPLASSGAFEVCWETKVAMAELIRRLTPDIIITMPPESMYAQPHSDHDHTHRLVWYGRDLAARPVELPSGRPPHFVNDLYFLGDGSPGDIFIEVTDVAPLVKQAHETLSYKDLLGAGHGALPEGVSLNRPVDYRRRVRPGMVVEAYRPHHYQEKVLPLFPC